MRRGRGRRREADESRLRIQAQAEIAARDFDKAWSWPGEVTSTWGCSGWPRPCGDTTRAGRFRSDCPGQPGGLGGTGRLTSAPVLEHRGNVDAHASFRPDGRAVADRRRTRHRPALGCGDRPAARAAPGPRRDGVLRVLARRPAGATGGDDGKVRTWDAATGRPDGPDLTPRRECGRGPDRLRRRPAAS